MTKQRHDITANIVTGLWTGWPTIHGLVPRRDKMFFSSPCSANLRICSLYSHTPHTSSLGHRDNFTHAHTLIQTSWLRCTEVDKFTVVVLVTMLTMLCRYKLYLSRWMMMMRKMRLRQVVLMTVMLKNVSCLLKRRYEKIPMLIQVSYLTERERMRKTDCERNWDKYIIYFLKFSLSQPVNAVILWVVRAAKKC